MVSIIIPVLNEAAQLPATLAAIQQQTSGAELLIVDAGSTDETVRIALAAGARVLHHPVQQRARQMNAGAKAAAGDVLLFLHADTHLPPVAIARIEQVLENPKVLGGGFVRRFDQDSAFLRLTCRLAAWRTRTLGWFLGDQAAFVRRAVFWELDGFPAWDLFEDLEFARRLARTGQLATLDPPVVSSGRRFAVRGAVRTTCQDFLLTLRYLLHSGSFTRASSTISDKLDALHE